MRGGEGYWTEANEYRGRSNNLNRDSQAFDILDPTHPPDFYDQQSFAILCVRWPVHSGKMVLVKWSHHGAGSCKTSATV